MVIKKIETRDYLRTFITRANKEAGEKREEAEKEKEYYRNHALSWNESCHQEGEKNKIISDFNIF